MIPRSGLIPENTSTYDVMVAYQPFKLIDQVQSLVCAFKKFKFVLMILRSGLIPENTGTYDVTVAYPSYERIDQVRFLVCAFKII